jgi:hypothetical protein
MADSNVYDMLVLKPFDSLNMMKPCDRDSRNKDLGYDYSLRNFWCIPRTMHSLTIIWKLFIVYGIMSLHMNVFWPKLILFIYSTQMSIIVLILPNGDSKHTYVFPLIECGVENIP